MYLDFKVPTPKTKGICVKRIKNTPYVYFKYSRVYLPEKKYNTAKMVCIGKLCPEQEDLMIPNTNFVKYFPEKAFPEGEQNTQRSSCIHVGSFFVIGKILEESGLNKIIRKVVGEDSGLFLDLVQYFVLAEENIVKYYHDYTYYHPLLTEKMRIYHSAEIIGCLKKFSGNLRTDFLYEWNVVHPWKMQERVYLCEGTCRRASYVEGSLADKGANKNGSENLEKQRYLTAYDGRTLEPLFYEVDYWNRTDRVNLSAMADRAAGYGYKRLGFVLERESFTGENTEWLAGHDCEFIVMLNSGEKLVDEVIREKCGTFENREECVVSSEKISGTTIKKKISVTDEREYYVHVYYNEREHIKECVWLKEKLERMEQQLKSWSGQQVRPTGDFQKYFELVYAQEGNKEVFCYGKALDEVFQEETRLCGYFVIITSENMTAADALHLYRLKEISGKLFQGNVQNGHHRDYLEDENVWLYEREIEETNVLIAFLALIIRNRMESCLLDRLPQERKMRKDMTVTEVMRELERIEMVKGLDGIYRLDREVTETQKCLLEAFGIAKEELDMQTKRISEELR